ncbi:MAG: hypothetical protein LBD41_08345, partial [Clostridiales Family XIII bacterium]|nr:hypothetical protein [Clostridiales Family XIII bacterium]
MTVLKSALSFTFYFVILCLVLSFWGRHLLALLKVENNQKPQMMLQIVAGMAILLFLGHAIYFYIQNLTFYLIIFFLIGFFGIFIEFYLVKIRSWLKKNNKITVIISGLAAKDAWLAAIVISLVISMFHSAGWPSGTMEGSANNSFDFHSWIFMAYHKLGLIDTTNPILTQRFINDEFDAIGTHILLAFISIARAQIPLYAAPAIVVTFMVWFGTALYELVRRAFKFKCFQALFISIALCLSNLFNYISLHGMFGHLLFLILFIITLTNLTKDNSVNLNIKDYILRQFFPFVTLFLAYQSGYILFSSYIILFTFILLFQTYKYNLFIRLYKSLYFSLLPLLIISCLSFLLAPGLAYHLFTRSAEVANQTEGWPLAFFNPLLFSGLPFYLSTDQFLTITPAYKIQIYHYIPLIFITILLTIVLKISYKRTRKNFISNININFILSLISIFIFSIVFYLLIFKLYGNNYKIWKYATFTILPLSFIPLSLVILILYDFFKIKFKLLPNFTLTIISIYFTYSLFNPSFLLNLKDKYYSIITNHFYLINLYSLNKKF